MILGEVWWGWRRKGETIRVDGRFEGENQKEKHKQSLRQFVQFPKLTRQRWLESLLLNPGNILEPDKTLSEVRNLSLNCESRCLTDWLEDELYFLAVFIGCCIATVSHPVYSLIIQTDICLYVHHKQFHKCFAKLDAGSITCLLNILNLVEVQIPQWSTYGLLTISPVICSCAVSHHNCYW